MDPGAKSGEKADKQGGGAYLDKLESLKAIAVDDADVLEAARPAVVLQ
jgi:hypothetical protein